MQGFWTGQLENKAVIRGMRMENLDLDVLSMRCHRQWSSGMMLVGLRDMNWA